MNLRKALMMGVLGASMLGMLGGTAFADSPQQNVPNGNGHGIWRSASPEHFDYTDDSCNNRGIYVQYDWDSNVGDGARSLNTTGCNTTAQEFVNVSGHSTIFWHVCEDIPDNPDSCSDVRSDAT